MSCKSIFESFEATYTITRVLSKMSDNWDDRLWAIVGEEINWDEGFNQLAPLILARVDEKLI